MSKKYVILEEVEEKEDKDDDSKEYQPNFLEKLVGGICDMVNDAGKCDHE